MESLGIAPDIRSYEFTISSASRDGDIANCHLVLQVYSAPLSLPTLSCVFLKLGWMQLSDIVAIVAKLLS